MACTAEESKKIHVSIVICGHVDAGKSTTTGRLIFELGGISQREMDKLKQEAEILGKASFAFAFYMDRQKDERARGVTISCTTKEFYTPNYHYTIIDAPGHRDFIKNMITGASQADVALVMVPADGNFTTAIARGNHKAGEVQGQTRQHARLINLLGVKQVIVGVNKMDCDLAGYKKERFDEIAAEMKNVLSKVGYKPDQIKNNIAILPLSGYQGDNLIKKSEKMPWWNGTKVTTVIGAPKEVHVNTLYEALDLYVLPPVREGTKLMRTPISGVYKIKGVGDVLTGRVEQGTVKPKDSVAFPPSNTAALACTGTVFTVEMHHKMVEQAGSGDNVGMNIKGLNKDNMPKVGDIMIGAKDTSLAGANNFTAQIQILDHPGKLAVGYTPIAFVRTGRAACRMSAIDWKIGKETGGKQLASPQYLQANEVAQAVFQPKAPFVVDSFKNCEGLGRVAIMEGNGVVMLGKIIKVTFGAVEPDKKK
jgi:elongation factor 1-alpha